ncbi:hypothetical protein M1B35_30205 [Pseudomonas sp. MAFF 302046]|uniref:Uncharacterized protein n=1 Tax=Pseudomonas morbosilactucae TaxID=2938197 RepID=A0ABT0JRM9_9PSED|nr:hypothetical protein [Pseudomonas morbosilactucae]MCK9818280.1 hypothetical protein [Pseudomonas morbosilactucae]
MTEEQSSGGTVLDQRKAMWNSGELQIRLVSQLVNPEAIKAIGSALFEIDNTVKSVFRPEVVSQIQSVIRHVDAVAGSTQFGQMARNIEALGGTVAAALRSPLVMYLISGRGPDLGSFVTLGGTASVSVNLSGDARVVTAAEIELEQQIIGRLESGETVESLTLAQRLHLFTIYKAICWLCVSLLAVNGARDDLCSLQPKLLPTMTSNQVARAVRSTLCDAPLEFLSPYRSVKGEGCA